MRCLLLACLVLSTCARAAHRTLLASLDADAARASDRHARLAALSHAPAPAPAPARRAPHRGSDTPYAYKRTIGHVPLFNAANERFYALLALGSPPTLAPVQLDTGSSDLWLRAAAFAGSAASSSFVRTGHALNISYMDGSSAAGFQGTDCVRMGGVEGRGTAVSVGEEVSAGAAEAPVQGVLGMGWPALATGHEDPFWLAAGLDVFSLHLASSSNVSDDTVYGGALLLDGVDPALYEGEINFVPLRRPLLGWTVTLDGLSVRGTPIPLFPSSSSSTSAAAAARRTPRHFRRADDDDDDHDHDDDDDDAAPRTMSALIDSGTSLLSVPPALARAFYAAVPGATPLPARASGATFYAYPCGTAVDASVVLGGVGYAVPDAVLVKGLDERPRKVAAGEMCVGAVYGNANGSGEGDFVILGDTFLRSVYTVFDARREAVGFAKLASTAPTSGPRFVLAANTTGALVNVSAPRGTGEAAGDGGAGSGAGAGAGRGTPVGSAAACVGALGRAWWGVGGSVLALGLGWVLC